VYLTEYHKQYQHPTADRTIFAISYVIGKSASGCKQPKKHLLTAGATRLDLRDSEARCRELLGAGALGRKGRTELKLDFGTVLGVVIRSACGTDVRFALGNRGTVIGPRGLWILGGGAPRDGWERIADLPLNEPGEPSVRPHHYLARKTARVHPLIRNS
jgi:hypothetical protein